MLEFTDTDWPDVTVMFTVAVFTQPLLFVPETVYVVVIVGVDVGEAIFETFKLPPGDHK